MLAAVVVFQKRGDLKDAAPPDDPHLMRQPINVSQPDAVRDLGLLLAR